jgi:hypothetical protein
MQECWSPLVKDLLSKPYISVKGGEEDLECIDWDILGEFLDRPVPAELQSDVVRPMTPPASKKTGKNDDASSGVKRSRLEPVSPKSSRKKSRYGLPGVGKFSI